MVTLPSDVGVPLVRYRRPPSVCVVAVLNGGGGLMCDAPCSDWVWHLRIVLLPVALFSLLSHSPASLLSCVVVFIVGGEVWWCVLSVHRCFVLCVLVCAICCGVCIVAWCGVWYCTVEERWVWVGVFRYSFSFPTLCLLSQRCWFRCVSFCQGCVIAEWR